MRFFRAEQQRADTTGEYTLLSQSERSAYTPISQSNVSCLSEMNRTFTFSDLTCITCLCLVPCFGIGGLCLGFTLAMYLIEHMENMSNGEIMAASVLTPFGFMFLFMALAFLIWGKSIDWAQTWETGDQRRGAGLVAVFLEFFSSANPCFVQLKEKLHSLAMSSTSHNEQESLEMRV